MNKKKSLSTLTISIIIGVLIIGVGAYFLYNKLGGDKSSNFTGDPKSLDGQIDILSKQIKADPKNSKLYINLSLEYLQKVRETADISYYQKIEDLMNQAEKISPGEPDIPATRAVVALGRHHFKEGNLLIQKAITLNPNRARYYGVLGDSQIELGQYKEAVRSFQKMADLRPDYSVYVRIAYIRELYGDIKGAKDALALAIDAGSNFKENIAFAYVELGKLDMRDNLPKAKEDFNSALKVVADYPPANEGLGKVAFFENDTASAQHYFEAAYNKLPIVQYAVDLADLNQAEGKVNEVKQNLTLAELAFTNSSSSGVNTDLEESLFLSDHDLSLDKALQQAERAYVDRPSTYAADYLSWALYKNNQADKAATYTKEALRLGEVDPLILFHQGMIALKNGNTGDAKRYLSESLKINPHFSILQSKIAADTLNSIK